MSALIQPCWSPSYTVPIAVGPLSKHEILCYSIVILHLDLPKQKNSVHDGVRSVAAPGATNSANEIDNVSFGCDRECFSTTLECCLKCLRLLDRCCAAPVAGVWCDALRLSKVTTTLTISVVVRYRYRMLGAGGKLPLDFVPLRHILPAQPPRASTATKIWPNSKLGTSFLRRVPALMCNGTTVYRSPWLIALTVCLQIARRRRAHQEANPDAAIISLGIGDTTEPIPPFIVDAMMKAAEGLGTLEGYSG